MHTPASPTRKKNYSRDVTPLSSSSSASASTPASPPGNVSTPIAAAAALKGATHAFQNNRGTTASIAASRLRPANVSGVNSGSSNSGKTAVTATATGREDGARLAATQAAAGARLSRHGTGGSWSGNGGVSLGAQDAGTGGELVDGLVAQRVAQYLRAGGGGGGSRAGGSDSAMSSPPLRPVSAMALVSGRGSGDGGKQASASASASASLIAAALAASRSASPVPGAKAQRSFDNWSVTGSGRQSAGPAGLGSRLVDPATDLGMDVGRVVMPTAESEAADTADTASIRPTTSLVSLFESKKCENVDPIKKRIPSLRLTSPDVDEHVPVQSEQQQQQQQKLKPKPKPKPSLPKAVGSAVQFNGGNESYLGVSQRMDTRSDGYDPMKARPEGILQPSNRTDSQDRQDRQRPTARTPEPHAHRHRSTPLYSHSARNSSPAPVSPKPGKLVNTPQLKPPMPPARASSIAKMIEPTTHVTAGQPDNDHTDTVSLDPERAPAPPRLFRNSTSSDDTFYSASSIQSPRDMSPARQPDQAPARASQLRPGSLPHTTSVPDLRQSSTPRASTPNLTLDSLTNAMVASNLASARLTPTWQLPPPTPAPRRHRANHGSRSPLQPQRTADSLRSQLTGGSRSPKRQAQPLPSPQRSGMLLQTLRGPPHPSLSDDEDARRRAEQRRHRRRSKVLTLGGGNRRHAHHEGSRRRWRDEITARERRRYEAVWASNRGLFLRPGWAFQHEANWPRGGGAQSSSSSSLPNPDYYSTEVQKTAQVELGRARDGDGPGADLVVNVVVRDLWSRSRLPADELAEVWDLVDRSRRGALARDEFVVGMWLIDQRLRGRKIPARVSQSVWESAGGGRVRWRRGAASEGGEGREEGGG
ncbi:hypothetical protein VTK56DRAFT_6913 [Thermocarpiscus australiensis]